MKGNNLERYVGGGGVPSSQQLEEFNYYHGEKKDECFFCYPTKTGVIEGAIYLFDFGRDQEVSCCADCHHTATLYNSQQRLQSKDAEVLHLCHNLKLGLLPSSSYLQQYKNREICNFCHIECESSSHKIPIPITHETGKMPGYFVLCDDCWNEAGQPDGSGLDSYHSNCSVCHKPYSFDDTEKMYQEDNYIEEEPICPCCYNTIHGDKPRFLNYVCKTCLDQTLTLDLALCKSGEEILEVQDMECTKPMCGNNYHIINAFKNEINDDLASNRHITDMVNVLHVEKFNVRTKVPYASIALEATLYQSKINLDSVIYIIRDISKDKKEVVITSSLIQGAFKGGQEMIEACYALINQNEFRYD